MAMTLRKRIGAALLAAALALAPLAARASQASLVTPEVGPHSMTDFTTNYLNPALAALGSNNAGPNAPTNGAGAAPYTYEWWVNTTASPPQVEIYDGTSWDIVCSLAGSGVCAVSAADIATALTTPGARAATWMMPPSTSALPSAMAV